VGVRTNRTGGVKVNFTTGKEYSRCGQGLEAPRDGCQKKKKDHRIFPGSYPHEGAGQPGG